MWSEEGLYLGRDGEDLYTLRSWRSDAVKFGRVLCRSCNNVRSQPFDEAYDVYAEFIQSNTARLSRATSIDWQEVYGADWQKSARLLGCYAVKSFGCWLAEGGFAPSKVFASFLDGGELVDTRLMLTRQQSVSLAYRAMELDGEPTFDGGIGVLGAVGWLNSERTHLIGYEQYSYISDICMRFNWFDTRARVNCSGQRRRRRWRSCPRPSVSARLLSGLEREPWHGARSVSSGDSDDACELVTCRR